ncbi:MAG: DUF6285 domain-containing protein [Archangium sp.]|nr:DUF6285 domain-containing protein [Archangium sp.]
MQNRPDHPTLLDAVASFLMADVVPKLEADKALQFRVLIAANLATVVAGELRTQPARSSAERSRLQALLATEGTLEDLNRELASALKANAFSPEQRERALEHLIATAKETLEVTNPRFELADEL